MQVADLALTLSGRRFRQKPGPERDPDRAQIEFGTALIFGARSGVTS
jgi:hypothetical protein